MSKNCPPDKEMLTSNYVTFLDLIPLKCWQLCYEHYASTVLQTQTPVLKGQKQDPSRLENELGMARA